MAAPIAPDVERRSVETNRNGGRCRRHKRNQPVVLGHDRKRTANPDGKHRRHSADLSCARHGKEGCKRSDPARAHQHREPCAAPIHEKRDDRCADKPAAAERQQRYGYEAPGRVEDRGKIGDREELWRHDNRSDANQAQHARIGENFPSPLRRRGRDDGREHSKRNDGCDRQRCENPQRRSPSPELTYPDGQGRSDNERGRCSVRYHRQ